MRSGSFHWRDTNGVIADLGDERCTLDDNRRAFTGERYRVRPPVVFPVPTTCTTIEDYWSTLPDEPGIHIVVLLQAGAAALGVFQSGEKLRTKSIKKYVVRGHGKAQSTHLSTRGKSRYGSRLRLQNARNLLIEVNRELREWFAEFGPPEHVYYSCPVRMWPELLGAKEPPPFDKDGPIRIPLDIPVPTTAVLLRTYRAMEHGFVEEL